MVINLITVLMAAILVGFLPGFFLYALIFKEKKKIFYEAIPLSLCFSFIILLFPTFLGFYFALSINFVLYFFLGEFCVVLFIFLCVHKKSFKDFLNFKTKKISFKDNKYLKILLVFLFLVLIRAVLTPGLQAGDMLRHVSEVRKIIEMPTISFGSSFIKESQGSANYGYNVLYIFMALVAKISFVDVVGVFLFIPIFFSVFLLLTYFYFSKVIFNNEKIAFYSTCIFFIWEVVLNYSITYPTIANFWYWSAIVPATIARNIIILMVIAFAFKYGKSGEKRYLYLLPFLSLVVAFLHVHYFLVLVTLFALILFFVTIFRFHDKLLIKRTIISFLAVFIPALPYSVFIISRLYPVLNPLYQTFLVSGNRPIKMIAGFPIVDPFKTVYFNFARCLGFLLMPFLIFYVRKRIFAVYLLALFLGPLLIVFNPLLLRFLQPFNPALDRVMRLNEFLPYGEVIGLFLFLFINKFGKKLKEGILKHSRREIISVIVLTSIIILTFCYKSINIAYVNSSTKAWEIKENSYLWEDKSLRNFVRGVMPPGSVVLMDNIMSAVWTYYFPHYVVSLNWGMDSYIPTNFDQRERYNEVEEYLAKNKLDSWCFDFLNKYEVDYILIDKRINNNDILMGKIKEKPFEQVPFQEYKETQYYQQKNFESYSNNFKLIYDSDKIKIYKYIK
jgi:hypothetical protein